MNAAFILDGKVSVGEVPDPTPAKGQVLVRTHSCGLCASDSHFLQSGANVVGLCQRHGGPYAGLDLQRPFVPDHEYVGEVIDDGAGSQKPINRRKL
jgi:D-arabinose 1-dehydrogenase-like Zn-dependent alcohol dehydrogenase